MDPVLIPTETETEPSATSFYSPGPYLVSCTASVMELCALPRETELGCSEHCFTSSHPHFKNILSISKSSGQNFSEALSLWKDNTADYTVKCSQHLPERSPSTIQGAGKQGSSLHLIKNLEMTRIQISKPKLCISFLKSKGPKLRKRVKVSLWNMCIETLWVTHTIARSMSWSSVTPGPHLAVS